MDVMCEEIWEWKIAEIFIKLSQISLHTWNNNKIFSDNNQRPWRRWICAESIKVRWREKIWQNSSKNLFLICKSMWHINISCILYEHIIMAGTEGLYRCLATRMDRQWRRNFDWCMYAIKYFFLYLCDVNCNIKLEF